MKSLEHTIKQVHEAKADKGTKRSLEHTIRKVGESKRDDIDGSMPKYGGFDKLNTESELSYMGSGTGGEPKMHTEDGKKKKVNEQDVEMSLKSPAAKLRMPKDMTGGPFAQPGPVMKYHPMYLPKNLRTQTPPQTQESVGSIGSNEYQGNQFKSVRTQTPHIKPPGPSGDHSQAPENVSRQRTLAKEKTSMTMHGKVSESEERKKIENVPRPGNADRHDIEYVGRNDSDPKTAKEKTSRQAAYKINVIDENRKLAGIVISAVNNKKQQIKTEGGMGQGSKTIRYPNGTEIIINPEVNRTSMDIDGKLPNNYK